MPNPRKDPEVRKTHNMKVLLNDAQYALVQNAAEAAGMKLLDEDFKLISDAFPAPDHKTYLDVV